LLTLLWGLPSDAPLAGVHRELRRLGAPVYLLDQRHVLETTVSLEVGAEVRGWVRDGDAVLDLADVGAVYLRPHDSTRVAAARAPAPGDAERRHAAAVEAALLCWADIASAYVVNRPTASASNGSKPYQLRRVAAAGFAVPETLVTNDPGEADAFARRHGTVIYKSVSGVRSRVRALTTSDADRLPDVLTCPTQFQRRVPGTDVRVHVVGAEVFAAEVTCGADDYRYAAEQGWPPARLAALQLPGEVAARCRRLAAQLGLPVAGIDLRRAEDGTWYCFEVNPSPAFTYYQTATGQPVAAAIAALLAAGALCTGAREVPQP
jgi:glutathione synthase/RimK-type ligase-like ATP-grasp enzyme